ncbi:alpha-glucosidase [Nitrospira moscoviensis]|uniref:Putative alpha-glucosidase n=1 Tax=Nitrospira moscoviensis TaxID=42253 RepID=A0A0K2GHC2_NITMO|nr:alpha-glucosidase [Nitrospira moscoviensis]ALA60254.1 putative alpha-glucosidase [Nitrospira moscoviensis]
MSDASRSSRSFWWHSAVFYQIYPWSFQDSDGDGIGDLAGIRSRLDYLRGGPGASLGIDAIWLSPIYPSPMKDFGYDVADYCNVDPRFGRLADFDELVREAHRRGIRVIMDLVLNHTSDRHPWFVESRASRQSAKRDWYCWADGMSFGRRPSNWNARFGGSSWTWDLGSRQYYLHSFLKEQPDLNWSNPAVRAALWDVVRFWLDRGVDGFRLDAINWLGKDVRWPDNPFRLGLRGYTRQHHRYDRDQPLAHDIMRELRSVVSSYPDVVLIGEAAADTPGGPASFYGQGEDELHLVFDFRLMKSPWRADRFRRFLADDVPAIPKGGWPTIVFSNHDQPRHIDRYGAGGDAEARARAAALLLLTMPGTPFLYYGEELGMRNGRLRYRDLRDPYTKRFWPFRPGRDPARRPMQWDASPHAGFSTGRPWLPVAPDYPGRNVLRNAGDPRSLWSLYRRLLELRRASPALSRGHYRLVEGGPGDCLLYERAARTDGGAIERMLIAVNFSERGLSFALPAGCAPGRVLLSTDPDASAGKWDPRQVRLSPNEGLLVGLSEPRGS